MTHIIRVYDLETADNEKPEGQAVEIGYCDLRAVGTDLLGAPTDWEVIGGTSWLVNPGRPISPATSAIHNLVDSDVADARPWREVVEPLFSLDQNIMAYAAHGAQTEIDWLKEFSGETPWICTYKAWVRLEPEAPAHSNGAVRYFLNPDGLDRTIASPVHRAFPDAYVTAFNLREALKRAPIADLIKWTGEPALTPRCYMGDYRNNGKGTPWRDVDTGMLTWIIRKMGDDPTREDLVATARYHLEQREIDQRLESERVDLNRQFAANGLPGHVMPDLPAAPGAKVARVDVEDPGMVPIDVWRAHDRIISPTGKVLKDRFAETGAQQGALF